MTNKLVSKYLEANAEYASTHTAPPPIAKIRGMAKENNMKGSVILSCSDPRLPPEAFLGAKSSPLTVIRNAGGRAMDAMRSIQVLHTLIPLELILVIHHTDCGTSHLKDAEVRENIKNSGSSIDTSDLEKMKFGEMLDLEESVKEDVKMLRDDPLFGKDVPTVVGMVYDLETGRLRELVFD